jgi:hypothetical protein
MEVSSTSSAGNTQAAAQAKPATPPVTLETKEKAEAKTTETREKAVPQAQEAQQQPPASSDPNVGRTINVVA